MGGTCVLAVLLWSNSGPWSHLETQEDFSTSHNSEISEKWNCNIKWFFILEWKDTHKKNENGREDQLGVCQTIVPLFECFNGCSFNILKCLGIKKSTIFIHWCLVKSCNQFFVCWDHPEVEVSEHKEVSSGRH